MDCGHKKQELSLGLGQSWVFQQNNDPKYTSKVMKKGTYQARIKELTSQNSDMNPMENMWTLLMKLACAGKAAGLVQMDSLSEVRTLKKF